jgi:hypothetical protein
LLVIQSLCARFCRSSQRSTPFLTVKSRAYANWGMIR